MLAAENVHTLTTAKPQADQFRLAALHRYQILDTPQCEDFTFITELAAKVCGVPYAFISLVDTDRVWVKAATGYALDTLARGDSYCSLAVMGEPSLEIPDLARDYRTVNMPLTTGEPYMRMYSSVALMSSDAFPIGTLSVMDTKPGQLDEDQQRMLARLGRQAMALIERRASERQLNTTARELELLSTTDELTGLHNRRSLLQKLKFEVARSKRFRTPLSAVMIDVDHFKKINDEFGHNAADQILANIGRLLRESVRVIDIPGRYGGEELCVILPNTPIEGACKFAETLRGKLESQLHYAGIRVVAVTASLGVGSFDHMEIADAESLLRQAENALARAKANGRNRVES
jgi:diguanylate cyclase (GGDEF)-like protein